MDIYFISSNEGKRRDVLSLLGSGSVRVHPLDAEIEEIQSVDMAKIAEDKVIKGFKQILRPVLVEQTGLLLPGYGGLPGGFTQIFWDTLGLEKFGQFFHSLSPGEAIAKSVFAYCDGRKIQVFEGSMAGQIVPVPRGASSFAWDCIFMPEGHTLTYAEMPPEEKILCSMRSAALEHVRHYLEERA